MTIQERLNSDLKDAMRKKDTFALAVIRLAKGAIQLESINKKKELSEDEVIGIISKQIKLRKDSITEFEKAGRDDLVRQNCAEIELLNKYMPEQFSEEEINNIIDEIFDSVRPNSIKDMGLIMKEISPKLKGRADMGYVNDMIKKRLNNL